MKHYQGLRLRAIGDLLGTSEETAKNSLSGHAKVAREPRCFQVAACAGESSIS